ncbi:hypothetical protein GCM10010129_80880 [Streptomyces fumigatiscleroticus]|nr:hypothetical protein GCM10010129_80880 [Streptomyces fumigatiscleroticus]
MGTSTCTLPSTHLPAWPTPSPSTHRLDTVTEQLGTVTDRHDTAERVLFALARTQGIDPGTTG